MILIVWLDQMPLKTVLLFQPSGTVKTWLLWSVNPLDILLVLTVLLASLNSTWQQFGTMAPTSMILTRLVIKKLDLMEKTRSLPSISDI